MSRIDDFEIEEGVLVEYRGQGGDVIIPSGVTAIGDEAFWLCSALTSVQSISMIAANNINTLKISFIFLFIRAT